MKNTFDILVHNSRIVFSCETLIKAYLEIVLRHKWTMKCNLKTYSGMTLIIGSRKESNFPIFMHLSISS